MARLAFALLAIVFVFCSPRPVAAQMYTAPTVSTYLNMLYTNPLGINLGYQNLTLPLNGARAAGNANSANIGRLQSEVNGLQNGTRGGRGGSGVGGAGQYFMNYSHYYPNLR